MFRIGIKNTIGSKRIYALSKLKYRVNLANETTNKDKLSTEKISLEIANGNNEKGIKINAKKDVFGAKLINRFG